MLRNSRVVFSDNGTLRDLSAVLNDVNAGAALFNCVYTQDALYIGSDLPFNHRYFQFSNFNLIASAVTVQLWDGSSWVDAVDVVDETADAGATFGKNGIISWVPDQNSSWQKVANTFDVVTGLSTLKIYNLYWVKLTFSASLTATTGISYCGHKFSKDTNLSGKYSELETQNAKDTFQEGKTDWDVQHILAAEDIVSDLRKKKVVWSRNQIVDWESFIDASIHKVAHMVYSQFGDAWIEKRDEAWRQYQLAMSGLNFDVDLNENAVLDEEEKVEFAGFFRV